MKLEKTLRRRLKSQETLLDAVSAMKSLSAHHFRLSRAALPAAREYRNDIEKIVEDIGFFEPARTGPPALLSVATDRGLCGGYTLQIAQLVTARHGECGFGQVYCVGKRQVRFLTQAGIKVSQMYAAPTSTSGITRVLLGVAQEVLADYLDDKFSTLEIISARFEGVGKFNPVSTRVLPVPSQKAVNRVAESPYVSRRHLMAVALREFFYITLFEILLDSLASEHGTRLEAMESAEEWLTERIAENQRALAAIHRETTTQEVLDVMVGARQRRRTKP